MGDNSSVLDALGALMEETGAGFTLWRLRNRGGFQANLRRPCGGWHIETGATAEEAVRNVVDHWARMDSLVPVNEPSIEDLLG